jgi:hypothetical protein
MATRWMVLVVVVAVAGAWLAYSRDPAREQVIHALAVLAGPAVGNRSADANWGDVAKKIGDFAAEERGVKDSVTRAENSTPPVGQ